MPPFVSMALSVASCTDSAIVHVSHLYYIVRVLRIWFESLRCLPFYIIIEFGVSSY